MDEENVLLQKLVDATITIDILAEIVKDVRRKLQNIYHL